MTSGTAWGERGPYACSTRRMPGQSRGWPDENRLVTEDGRRPFRTLASSVETHSAWRPLASPRRSCGRSRRTETGLRIARGLRRSSGSRLRITRTLTVRHEVPTAIVSSISGGHRHDPSKVRVCSGPSKQICNHLAPISSSPDVYQYSPKPLIGDDERIYPR